MPQLTGRMAIVGNKDVVSLSTVDVYELASAIGAQFEPTAKSKFNLLKIKQKMTNHMVW